MALQPDASDQIVPLDALAPSWTSGPALDPRDVTHISIVTAGRQARPARFSVERIELVEVVR